MKVIGYEEADSKLNWSEMADAMEAGHKLEPAEIGDLLLAKGDRSILNRAAWIDGMGIALKSVTIFPENNNRVPPIPSIQGAMFVFDSDTGALEAIVDGPLVTKWKTAGDSVLGARLLARKDSENYLVVGAGTVAKTLLQAYREVFPSLKKFTVWNRSKGRAEELAEEMKSEGFELIVADDLEAAAREADIISTATMAKEPVLKGEWVQEGTHVDLIGAFRPDMREADDDLMLKGRLFVDARETTIGEIGELMIPMAAGLFADDHVVADFRDLCNGAPGRGADSEITLFKNGGGAHLDLMTARMIVEKMNS
ncbi:ornithine cyclodeaminase [Sneathiella sp. P13V-1]|uniref:ornithine cyclodeaminase family protein n=1 Tax=Sneathiella sp. P13V-1 TaxID=2697366 RepID=UPI00187BAC1B|nr:ornithine cyclodeaminase [Sneathiella sp. P13V-1]MBE7637226.1 ornithine cyclodeaminase [Sneathiella sp. P13V-1]